MLKVDISTPKNPDSILLLDEQDAYLLEGVRWTPDARPNGLKYAHRRPDHSPKLYIHRLIMQPEQGFVVDHIDRNGLNNCRANLRVVRQSVNNWNKGAKSNAASQYKGVWPKRGKWCAGITHNGHPYFLGTFGTELDAAIAFDAAALALGLERLGLNFPERETAPRLSPVDRAPNEWGYPGVRLLPSGRFGVRVIKNGRRYSIGSFTDPIDAIAAAEAERGS